MITFQYTVCILQVLILRAVDRNISPSTHKPGQFGTAGVQSGLKSQTWTVIHNLITCISGTHILEKISPSFIEQPCHFLNFLFRSHPLWMSLIYAFIELIIIVNPLLSKYSGKTEDAFCILIVLLLLQETGCTRLPWRLYFGEMKWTREMFTHWLMAMLLTWQLAARRASSETSVKHTTLY